MAPSRSAARAVRRLVKETVSAAAGAVNPWGVPTFKLNGAFLLPDGRKNHVTFGFTQGTSLLDTDKLLEGKGKNLRHVKLKKPEPANHPCLRKLIENAAALNGTKPANAAMRAGRR